MKTMNARTAVDRFLVRSHRRFPVCYSVAFRSTDGLVKGKGLVVEMSAGGWMILGEGPAVGTSLRVFGAKIEGVDPHELLQLKQRIKTLKTTR
jgi:hypothetical protein